MEEVTIILLLLLKYKCERKQNNFIVLGKVKTLSDFRRLLLNVSTCFHYVHKINIYIGPSHYKLVYPQIQSHINFLSPKVMFI